MPVIPAPATPTHELPGTAFTSLATPTTGSHETAVWQVAIEPGTPATPHSLTREEVFVVLSGTATVQLGAHRSTAATGAAIVVPADTEFSLGNEGDEQLRMLCCLPVGGQARFSADSAPFTPPWAE